MRIAYKNVCSIRDAVVDFEPGKLICIMGESNNGKSALFYAFVDGFTNSPDFKKWINNDALAEDPKSTAWIGLTDDEGNLWQVEAGTGHLNYRANDVKYEKVGRKGLFDLIGNQIPGLLYDPEDTRLIMNVQDEDSGMFPIDRSDTQIFKTYERLLSLSCTEDILRTIKIDKDDLEYKISNLSTSIQNQKVQIEKIKETKEKIDNTEVTTISNTLKNFIAKTNHYSSLVETVSKDAKYIDKVSTIPDESIIDFDTSVFERQLNNLMKTSSLRKYILSTELAYTQDIDFDLDKVTQILQSTASALSIQKDLLELNSLIKSDEQELEGIISILNTIKTCPLCGHSMED